MPIYFVFYFISRNKLGPLPWYKRTLQSMGTAVAAVGDKGNTGTAPSCAGLGAGASPRHRGASPSRTGVRQSVPLIQPPSILTSRSPWTNKWRIKLSSAPERTAHVAVVSFL